MPTVRGCSKTRRSGSLCLCYPHLYLYAVLFTSPHVQIGFLGLDSDMNRTVCQLPSLNGDGQLDGMQHEAELCSNVHPAAHAVADCIGQISDSLIGCVCVSVSANKFALKDRGRGVSYTVPQCMV